ncbi:MAG: DUF5722 domain-containing protein [Eubacteriales bacterium]|nr:DUF5722 domain-containing protein [Eubacteriales bacterium]
MTVKTRTFSALRPLFFAAALLVLFCFTGYGRLRAYADETAAPPERVTWNACYIDGSMVEIKGELSGGITSPETAAGSDQNLYLLELEPWDDDVTDNHFTTRTEKKLGSLEFKLSLQLDTAKSRLYNKFIACIWDGTRYIPVSEPIYINNPEAVAANKDAYTDSYTKKGLLIELSQVDDAFELGVGQVIVNIPYNAIFGEGIDYTYEGETYHFNKAIVEAYDRTISTFSGKSMLVNAVILNGWNSSTPDLYYPGTQKTAAANYYHFNSRTQAGYKDIKAVASFLADRYSGRNTNYGRIQNWIIGNEVNNQQWNYIGPMPLSHYVNEYERTFRIFYTAIKSTCANDRVFFSTDYNWMNEANGSTKYGAKEFIDQFAALVSQRGNIDWNLAYHPYSIPMTEPEFWDDSATGLTNWTETSPVVNFSNLAVLTDYMQRSGLRDREGNVRHIILSEQGFTSQSLTRGTCEELQAAAFAYAYYLVDSNRYIDAFILSRQIDAPSEVATSCAFGLWTTDATTDNNITPVRKKYIWNVFKEIDKRSRTLETTEFAKEIIGIKKWSDIIPGFKWTRFEN